MLYYPAAEEIVLMSSLNLTRCKLRPLPSNLPSVSSSSSKFPGCIAAGGYSAPGTKLHTPYWSSSGPIHKRFRIPLDWSSMVQHAKNFLSFSIAHKFFEGVFSLMTMKMLNNNSSTQLLTSHQLGVRPLTTILQTSWSRWFST